VPALSEALAGLYQRAPMGMRLGLGPMAEACARAGHPERGLFVVHVAGTNGKGSVSAMVEAMARAHGLRTGLYTSPHLCRFAERIRVNGAPIDDDALAAALGAALVLGPELSFFETATLAALLALRDAKVDLAVLEVGLGGRLDATNVIPTPAAAGITRIALDHTELLGSTLEAIAREKAAIAKPGLDLLVGPGAEPVLGAIRATAEALGATVSRAADDPAAVAWVQNATIGLAGRHQRENALLATALARRVGLPREACLAGLEGARWPGRLETLTTKEGDVLLDAAHNPDGAEALAAHLADLGRAPTSTALVFGALSDKDWPRMLEPLAARCAHRTYIAPLSRVATTRAPADPRAMAAAHAGKIAPDVDAALRAARTAVGPGGLVVVCGSIFLVGDVRARLLALPRDPPVGL
jgi:dihydrofolate synthase/folylpolyglutamate synthase